MVNEISIKTGPSVGHENSLSDAESRNGIALVWEGDLGLTLLTWSFATSAVGKWILLDNTKALGNTNATDTTSDNLRREKSEM